MFHYEFALFNNYLANFDTEFVLLMIPTVEKYLNSVNHLHEYHLEGIQFFNNLCSYFYERKDIKILKYLFEKQLKLIQNKEEQLSINELYKIKFFTYILNSKDLTLLFDEMKMLNLDNLMAQMIELK